MSAVMEIQNRKIGPGRPAYIVAEVSGNHGQDFDQAVRILQAAKEAGADAVKLQTYTPDTMTIDCQNSYFQIQDTIWEGRNLYDLYREAHTPWEWHPRLQEVARGLGLDFFSTPFDESAVEFLESLHVPAYKIASFEIVDWPLIRRIARTGKPTILSTGMATLEEIREAVRVFREAGGRSIALLKCTSAYPAPPEEMNLRGIPYLAETFGVPVGLSDHTMAATLPAIAVSLGASIIEKHLTLSRSIPGPDSVFSLEPPEFRAMVEAVRTTEKALGRVEFGVGGQESKSRTFRRSLFVVEDIRAGETFTAGNVRAIRPAYGLHPGFLEKILGRQATSNISRGTPLILEMVRGIEG